MLRGRWAKYVRHHSTKSHASETSDKKSLTQAIF